MKIVDSSVIIAFYSELGMPEMLHMHDGLHVPTNVVGEITKDETVEILDRKIKDGSMNVFEPENEEDIQRLRDRFPYLGDGELEVILCAMKLRGKGTDCCCVIDDKRARKVAERYDIKCIGTKDLIDDLLQRDDIDTETKSTIRNNLRGTWVEF